MGRLFLVKSLKMLGTAKAANEKSRILMDLTHRWTPQAEAPVAALLKTPAEDFVVRTTAALALILHGTEDCHNFILDYAQTGSFSERKRWFELLSDPRHKKRTGVDPRVAKIGFSLILEEQKLSPDYIHGAYFLAIRTGSYVGREFKPDQNDSRYQGKHGLADEFFADTVMNALTWWTKNKLKIEKELSTMASGERVKPRRRHQSGFQNNMDDSYCIAFREKGPGIISLKPDEETADRHYANRHQLPGRPLHFFNGFREEMAAEGEKEEIGDVMFAGAVFMVSKRVYQMIADFDIAGLQYYPSVYEADDGTMHDYMFLIFAGTKGRDWYDRELSAIDEEEDLEEGEKPFVDRFVLDKKRLGAIPEEQRLMFRMTGVMNPRIFVHRRIVDIFSSNGVTGIRFFRVSEYEDGMELE